MNKITNATFAELITNPDDPTDIGAMLKIEFEKPDKILMDYLVENIQAVYTGDDEKSIKIKVKDKAGVSSIISMLKNSVEYFYRLSVEELEKAAKDAIRVLYSAPVTKTFWQKIGLSK
jgi:hypothetical protein